MTSYNPLSEHNDLTLLVLGLIPPSGAALHVLI